MKTEVEEVQLVIYMLCCLGVKAKHTSLVCSETMGLIQNCNMEDSFPDKKYVAIGFHRTREASAVGILNTKNIRYEHNFADLLTKYFTSKIFRESFWGINLWLRAGVYLIDGLIGVTSFME